MDTDKALILPLTLFYVPIRPEESAFTVPFAFLPWSYINGAIRPEVSALAVDVAVFELSHVAMSIRRPRVMTLAV